MFTSKTHNSSMKRCISSWRRGARWNSLSSSYPSSLALNHSNGSNLLSNLSSHTLSSNHNVGAIRNFTSSLNPSETSHSLTSRRSSAHRRLRQLNGFLQFRDYSNAQSKKYRLVKRNLAHSIGIRAEDESDPDSWERRAPLAPSHVTDLIRQGVDVFVETSRTRCFSDEEYREAGAKVVESLAHVDTIFGIRPIPPHKLYPEKTYVYFSGVTKGENLKSLDRILENKIRLIDYEKIEDDSGQRLVRFGQFAGISSAIDTFHALGERLLVEHKCSTPFINIGSSKNYSSLEDAEESIKEIGENIGRYGLPADMFPFTITITGDGNVSKGIQRILKLVPHKFVTEEELRDIWVHKKNVKEGDPEIQMVYVCVMDPSRTMRRKVKDSKMPKFDREHFRRNPDQYESIFPQVLPYTRVWFNAIKWDERFPKLVTTEEAQELLRNEQLPLLAVSDLTADVHGSCGFLPKKSTLSEPYFVYNLRKNKASNFTARGEGILTSSIDNWPAGFPRSSSALFGEKLLPFVKSIASSDMHKPMDDQLKLLPNEVRNAIVTSQSTYMPRFKKLEELKKKLDKTTISHDEPKKVLLLGSGLVTAPIVEYLTRQSYVRITVAGNDEESATQLCKDYGRTRAQAISLDVRNQEKLDAEIRRHDLVLSLVPAPMHPPIAKASLKNNKPMMTASYISPEMKKLDKEAREKNLLILNEIGVDPGIDHMEVFHIMDDVRQKGGRVVSFQSYCGALPAPEFSDNPFGYKFSWSPAGVISASQNPAIFKEAGEQKQVDGKSLMFSAVPLVKKATFAPGFAFETLPNRDSLKYIDFYRFDKDAIQTMVRGTLRFPGFCNMFRCLKVLGLFDDETRIEFFGGAKSIPWRSVLIDLSGAPEDISNEELINFLVEKIRVLLKAKFRDLHIKQTDAEILAGARSAVTGMIKLGMMEPSEMIEKEDDLTLMQATCNLFGKKLVYREGERDMIFMHHEFIVQYPEDRERISSTLCVYGEEDQDDGFSATAKTVGYPLAMAADLFLRGQLNGVTGVIGPTEPQIYNQVLEMLKEEGISSRHSRTKLFLDEYFDE